jgi:hypothetical protein
VNIVHRQVLQISALHLFLREVLFAYGAVETAVGGGYIPSRLFKVLVPARKSTKILLMCFAKNEQRIPATLVWTMRICKSRTSKETYRTQRTRTVDRDDKKLFLYHASAEEKSSAPSNAVSDQKVEMEGLAQRAIGSENIGHLLKNRIVGRPTVNGRENCSFSAALHSGTGEYAPLRSIL